MFQSVVFVVTIYFLAVVHAFSSSTTSRQFIELTNPLRPDNDRLPVSLVDNWPTFVLKPTISMNFVKIPDDGGFVNPTSVNSLWQPQDLKQPDCILALGLFVRNGAIRHVFPAVDISFGGQYRNRGLCSVPRAFQWMDFDALMAGGAVCSLELQVRDKDQEEWKTLKVVGSIQESLNLAIEALADETPKELADGSSIIHVVCSSDIVTCPKSGSELRALLKEDDHIVGTLQVTVEKTAPGSESEYLPEAYKPLFQDESLRRRAFMEAKRRMMRKSNEDDES